MIGPRTKRLLSKAAISVDEIEALPAGDAPATLVLNPDRVSPRFRTKRYLLWDIVAGAPAGRIWAKCQEDGELAEWSLNDFVGRYIGHRAA